MTDLTQIDNIDVSYLPLVSINRGKTLESLHHGIIAISNKNGDVIASYGNIDTVVYLRSSAKPFQLLPFIEIEGDLYFDFSAEEIALMSSSHEGTPDHVRVATQIQKKIGIDESTLLCGSHYPYDEETKNELLINNQKPTPNHNNCSGKHCGMIAYAYFKGLSIDDYVVNRHPIQKQMRTLFANMCDVEEKEIQIGIDGCGAPNFAVPMKNAAIAFAKLVNPKGMSGAKVNGCNKITDAMLAYPEMISGHGKFDTELMKVGKGKIISKGGAEGYQAIGLKEGAISPDSEALGIVIKLADGDVTNRALPAVTLSVLQQLGAIDEEQLGALTKFGPSKEFTNVLGDVVGRQEILFNLSV